MVMKRKSTVQSDNFLNNIDSEGYIDNETDKEYPITGYFLFILQMTIIIM